MDADMAVARGAITRRACSFTSSLGLVRSRAKMETAPWSTTTRQCSDVPAATFVNAQALSIWSSVLSSLYTTGEVCEDGTALDMRLDEGPHLQKLYEAWDDPCGDRLLDGGCLLEAQKLPDL